MNLTDVRPRGVGFKQRMYRKFFQPDTPEPRSFTVTDRERGFVWVLESWEPWHRYHRVAYLFGEEQAERVVGFNVVQKGARDAFFRPRTDTDFIQARAWHRDAGLAVAPFDTITPERIIGND